MIFGNYSSTMMTTLRLAEQAIELAKTLADQNDVVFAGAGARYGGDPHPARQREVRLILQRLRIAPSFLTPNEILGLHADGQEFHQTVRHILRETAGAAR